jgi:hypothetical protein
MCCVLCAVDVSIAPSGGVLAVKVVSLKHLMGDSYEAGLRREALVLELAAMQDYTHPNLLTMQVRRVCLLVGSSTVYVQGSNGSTLQLEAGVL